MAAGKSNLLKTGLFVLISGVLVYFVFRNTHFEDIKMGIVNADLTWLLVSMCIAIFSHLFRALRWNLALEPLGYTINNRRSFYAVMIGYLVNLATARGGEIARCAIINQTDKVPINVLIGTVITERIIDLICLILAIVAAFLLQTELIGGFLDVYLLQPLLSKGYMGALVIAMVVFGFAFMVWLVTANAGRNLLIKLPFGAAIVNTLNGFVQGLSSVAKIKRPVLFIAYSLGIWLCYWMMTYSLFFCFDFTSNFSPVVGLTALVFASIGMIVPAPGGAGALALVIIGMENIYGLTNSNAQLVSTMSISANIILIIIVGITSLLMLGFERKKNTKNELDSNP